MEEMLLGCGLRPDARERRGMNKLLRMQLGERIMDEVA